MSSVQVSQVSQTPARTTNSGWKDWLGIVASIGCAIHCAAMPFVIAYLPAIGLSFLADEAFHKWMALACFLIAVSAFVPGIRKHGSWIPLGVGCIGLGIITFAAFGLDCDCCPPKSSGGSDSTAAVATNCECCDSGSCNNSGKDSTGENSNTPNNQVAAGIGIDSASPFLAALTPWVTPFGGLLLVTAHLLNRRYGLGGCCSTCS